MDGAETKHIHSQTHKTWTETVVHTNGSLISENNFFLSVYHYYLKLKKIRALLLGISVQLRSSASLRKRQGLNIASMCKFHYQEDKATKQLIWSFFLIASILKISWANRPPLTPFPNCVRTALQKFPPSQTGVSGREIKDLGAWLKKITWTSQLYICLAEKFYMIWNHWYIFPLPAIVIEKYVLFCISNWDGTDGQGFV